MIRHIISILIMALMILISSNALAAQAITVTLDGAKINFDVEPVLENGRVLVPLRNIFEALGAKVDWDNTTKTVSAMKNGDIIKLTIGNKVVYRNEYAVALDVPAIIIKGRTLVPIRFVSEALDAQVNWQGSNQTVIIKNLQLYYEQVLSHLIEGDLVGAREIVINAPKKYMHPELSYSGEASFSYTYFFPEGEAMVYYFWHGNNLSYVEARDNVFTIVWETLIEQDPKNEGKVLEIQDTITRYLNRFNKYYLREERGNLPLIEKPLVFFQHHPAISVIRFGRINTDGQEIELGNTSDFKKKVVPIEDEVAKKD